MRDGDELRLELPDSVRHVLAGLADAGFEAALVGGCVRDAVRGEQPTDWDVATSAAPEQVVHAFERSTWENPFGTVTVLADDGPAVEVTTYRREGAYRDRRRPERVEWGSSLAEDLSRRDFTINAMAWTPVALDDGRGRLVDPYGGAADLAAGRLRAVGEAEERIAEDALRMVRAVRFAARFDMTLEAGTATAIRRHAPAASTLSGERVREELVRILAGAAPPSRALRDMEQLGLLSVLLPELAALRGVPQAKALPGDALDHSLRTVDALPASDPLLRLAGLLHDLGKATTLVDGHFIGHEREGAELAERVMQRLRFARPQVARATRLVRHHMFDYQPQWTDAAVRRFVRRVGADLLEDLFALRAADDVASGVDGGPALAELRRRSAEALGRDPLEARQLAVDGHDLVAELGLSPGPRIGRLLDQLMEEVLDDPSLNRRDALIDLARKLSSQPTAGAPAQRERRSRHPEGS